MEQLQREIDAEADSRELSGGSSSSTKPAAVAFDKDFWEVREDKIIRYHCVPRRDMFSPDLTDCPVPISKLSNNRSTKIVPIGGMNIINHEDDWRNIRKRNKRYSFKWIGQTIIPFTKKSLPPSGECALSADPYPAMPTVVPEPEAEPEHREKVSSYAPVSEEEVYELMAMVARPVGHKELKSNPKAQASLDVEWDKLMKKKAWDMGSVREWKSVSDEAKKKGKKVHVGKVFEICVEKGSELIH